MAELIDPFDSPQTAPVPQAQAPAPAPEPMQAQPQQGGLVDPFDSPSGYGDLQTVTPQGPANLPPLAPQQQYQYQTGARSPEMTQITSNPNPVGVMDAARFATIEDPRVRIQKYAEQRFPNELPGVREGRYRDVHGEIVYRDPGTGGIHPEVSGVMPTIADFVGRSSLPIVGAILGTMLGGPVGGAVGGMSGLGYRKTAGLAQGDVQDREGNVSELLTQGAIDAVVPAVAGKVASGIANRNAAKDILNFDKAAAQRLQAIASAKGITLTPAELTRMGSLINQQNRYSAGMDPAGDVMSRFYAARGQRINEVMDEFLGKAPDLSVAGASAKRVAGQSLDDAQKAVTASSSSRYDEVVSPENLVPERRFMDIDADPLINEYINAAKESTKFGLMDAPRNSTAVIHVAGRLMREEAARLAGVPGMKGQVTEEALKRGRRKLLGFMEETYPAYKEARTINAQTREAVLTPLKEGIEGVIAKTKGTALHGIPDKLLNSKGVSAASVANWRKQFESQGMSKEWDQLVDSYMRQVWEAKSTKGKTVKDMAGSTFREQVFGTVGQQKIMREAMGPKRFQDFRDFMEVLEATGLAGRRQSMTTPAAEAAKEEARQAAPIISRANDFEITAPQRFLTNWWVENRQGNWRESLARVITSPDAVKEMEKLRVLRSMSPGSKRKVEVAAQVMAKAIASYPTGPEATHLPSQ